MAPYVPPQPDNTAAGMVVAPAARAGQLLPLPAALVEDLLGQKRARFRETRDKLRALVSALTDKDRVVGGKEGEAFLSACRAYLETGSGYFPVGRNGARSAYADLLEEIDAYQNGAALTVGFAEGLYLMLARLNSRWHRVTEAYAKARLNMLR